MAQITVSKLATGTWTCPAGITAVKIQAWGAGGTGGSSNVADGAGGGGAGGSYVLRENYHVIPGTVYTVTCGTGVAATTPSANNTAPSGNDSWFDSSSGVLAKGGAGGQNRSTAGTGTKGTGSTTGCIGDTFFAGGNGANGVLTSAAPTLRAASGGIGDPGGTSVAITLPTGWAAGDWCAVIIGINDNAFGVWNTTTGWTNKANHQNFVDSNFTTLVATRILQAGDLNPTFTTNATGKYSWCAIAFTPGAGATISEDGFSATGANQGDATSHTAGALTAVQTNVTSVILNSIKAVPVATTAVSGTPPTNWTEPTNGDQSTNTGATSALRQVGVEVSYRLAQTGTVTPGATTTPALTDADCYHFLITSTEPTIGGGGGGGAGSGGVGGNAALSVAGTGTATGGGGGSTGTSVASAAAATQAGGGGGGARSTSASVFSGGVGGTGRVDITYEQNAITQNVIQNVAVIRSTVF